LYFSAHGEVPKVIQVTSPDAGDGKTTLAANLAVSIAQSGKRIILIDADFRKPRQHKLFHVSSEVGLASVIAEQAELKEAIQPTAVENLDLLPCGPRPQNPAELLTSPRFKELLDAISEEYAWVLIDTPPLLAVSDPSVVAARVDGVLLVIRAAKNGRPNAERAREILYTLGANVVGVIVNGAARDGRAGGYGYHYGPYQYYDYYPGGQGEGPESAGRKRAHRSANVNGERLAAGSWFEKLRSWWPR
jgi:capsular exopolysaccharide synthesis family protein